MTSPLRIARLAAQDQALSARWDEFVLAHRQATFFHRSGWLRVIERVFGHLTCTPGLLGPLPAFVRGLARVRRWVGAKICLYHARESAREPRA